MEYHYDAKAADAAVAFFRRLRLTEGEWAGRPFVLEPWQENDIVRPVFGWKRPDGTRRYRRVYVWVPRKNGKTELAAGMGLAMEVGDAEPGAQVYSMAADKAQAAIVFNKATTMVRLSEDLAAHLECLKTAIYCSALNASFRPLSGVPEGKHGLNMSGLIGDEIHEWPDDRLYTFLHQSSAARRQPLEFLISTAGEKRGYGWEIWQYCQRILEGTVEDEETLVVVYAADPADAWDDPKTWAKANPNLGISVKETYLAAECAKAKELPRLENDFKRYHLNLWTEQAVRWIPLERWDACAGETPWTELAATLEGEPCYAGLDLSQTVDLTARVLVFPPNGVRRQWAILPRFYVPEARIAERVRRDKVPYDQWQAAGALQTTPGNVVDYDFVQSDLLADAERFRILQTGFDPFNAMQLMLRCQDEGLPCEEVRQGYLSLSGPSKELERLVLDRDLVHGGHPVLRWCLGNVAVDTDPAGNIKPSKKSSTERIDGVAATVTALALAIRGEEGPVMELTRDAVMVI